jgi:hypothetical protein
MFQQSRSEGSRSSTIAAARAAQWLGLAASLAIAGVAAADGDVSAAVDPRGNLVVVGDGADNRIDVARTGTPDEYVVSGLSGTTVNGVAEVFLIAPGDVRVSLRGGDDRVRVDGNVPGNVDVSGGPGADVLGLGCPVVGGNVTLSGGPGDDLVDIQDTLLTADLAVRTGSGSDMVHFFFAIVAGDTSIRTAAGDDQVAALQTSFGGSLNVATGAGEDGAAVVNTDVAGELSVRLGGANDTLEIGCANVTGATHANGGAGTDQFEDGGNNTFSGGLDLERFELLTGTTSCVP